jgi:hypothetical protein
MLQKLAPDLSGMPQFKWLTQQASKLFEVLSEVSRSRLLEPKTSFDESG